jgi:hypothetical protein
MNIVTKISNKLIFNSLTTQITFNASKMQASSTQNTKDSAGKRLGYIFLLSSQIEKIRWLISYARRYHC